MLQFIDFSAITSEAVNTAIVGFLIVFSALILLFLIFQFLPNLLEALFNRPSKKLSVEPGERDPKKDEPISGEVNAAVSMALYLYFEELHDEEERILTMEKVSRTYSPWSSKIYGIYHSRFN